MASGLRNETLGGFQIGTQTAFSGLNLVITRGRTITGTFAGLAGILMAFRLLSARTAIGQTWLLPSIAAPVIGKK